MAPSRTSCPVIFCPNAAIGKNNLYWRTVFSVRVDGHVRSVIVLLEMVELDQGVIELVLVVFPRNVPRILKLDKRRIRKAFFNALFAFPINVFLAVRDHYRLSLIHISEPTRL